MLWLAQTTLFVVVFGLSFLSGRVLDEWILITVNSVAGLLLALFWLLPTLRYLATFVDVTTTRVILRGGLFSKVQREISTSQITGVEYSRSRGIVILVGDESPLILTRMPKPKALAEELRRTLAK